MSKRKKNPNINVDASGNPIRPVSEAKQKHLEKKQVKLVVGKTPGQQAYIDSILNNNITITNGPYGSGKTFISVSIGIKYLLEGKVKQLVISRPAISACGEDQGAYPGSFLEKLMPFMLPVIDELRHYISAADIKKMIEMEQIRLIPIALLRGHNWHDTFAIIDECANLTFGQVELILSRFGEGSKLVMSSDFNQSDLPPHKRGGFRAFFDILRGMQGVGICHLTEDDIVRSSFVKEILKRVKEYRGDIESLEEIKEHFIKY